MNEYERQNKHEHWEVAPGENKIIELDDVSSLGVFIIRGRIDVIGTDDNYAQLEISNVAGKPVGVQFKNGHLVVTHPKDAVRSVHGNSVTVDVHGWGGLFGFRHEHLHADISLLVPRGTKVEVASVQGDTLISGLDHGAELSTVSGSVISDGLRGKLELSNVSGKVEARNHHGSIEANTVSGEVVLSGDFRDIEINSVSGDLYVDALGAPRRIEANAVSANMAIRLDPRVRAEYTMSTMNGKAVINGNRFHTRLKGFKYSDGPEDGPVTTIEFNGLSGNLKSVRREPLRFDEDEQDKAPHDGDEHDDSTHYAGGEEQ
ncbi:MAG: hypothetical protein LKF99_02320 [Bifidobacterium sp.]|jgi:DUF4097 and DUF4098 domain-containing protein YvlB|nr:hypothetical protein [Bifidobacterium sp.]